MAVFRVAYSFLPPQLSAFPPPSPALTPVNHCFHFDPDSKECLTTHRLVKTFLRSFAMIQAAADAEGWRTIIKLIIGADHARETDNGFLFTFSNTLAHTTRNYLLPPHLGMPIPAPHAKAHSPQCAMLLCADYPVITHAIEKAWGTCLQRTARGTTSTGSVGAKPAETRAAGGGGVRARAGARNRDVHAGYEAGAAGG